MKFRNTTFKALVIGVAIFAMAHVASAQILLNKVLTNGVNLVRSGATAVNELQITDTSGAANWITLLDNNSASSTNTIKPSYITYAYSRYTNTTTFTNLAGVVQTNNFVYVARVATTNALATNVANVVYRVLIPASATVSILPNNPYTFGLGVQVLAGSNAVMNGVYEPLP